MSMPFGNQLLRIIAIRYSVLMEGENALIFVPTVDSKLQGLNFHKNDRNFRAYNPIQARNAGFVFKNGERANGKFSCEWEAGASGGRPLDSVAVGVAGVLGNDRHKIWMWD